MKVLTRSDKTERFILDMFALIGFALCALGIVLAVAGPVEDDAKAIVTSVSEKDYGIVRSCSLDYEFSRGSSLYEGSDVEWKWFTSSCPVEEYMISGHTVPENVTVFYSVDDPDVSKLSSAFDVQELIAVSFIVVGGVLLLFCAYRS